MGSMKIPFIAGTIAEAFAHVCLIKSLRTFSYTETEETRAPGI